jgi:hypothetical protein
LSGRGLCDKLITSPEEFYQLWCVTVWSKNLVLVEALAHWGLSRQKQTNKQTISKQGLPVSRMWPQNVQHITINLWSQKKKNGTRNPYCSHYTNAGRGYFGRIKLYIHKE